VSKYLSVAEQK